MLMVLVMIHGMQQAFFLPITNVAALPDTLVYGCTHRTHETSRMLYAAVYVYSVLRGGGG